MAASAHPSEILQPGDQVTVQVLKYEPQKERISLGMKQLLPDPWENIEERYPVESRVIGRVVNVADYGAFVELEPGVEGLIHVSEMTWSRRMKHPSKVVKPGDQVETVVLEVHPKERRISLGLKQLEANPWSTIETRYSIGSVVEGRVRNMTDFGAFIEIEEGIDGLVHVSDLSWTKRVKHPSEVLRKGLHHAGGDSGHRFPSASGSRWASSNFSPTPGKRTFKTTTSMIWCTARFAGSPASALSWNWPRV